MYSINNKNAAMPIARPAIFIVAGLVLVFTPKKKQPWENENWNAANEPVTEAKADDKTEDTPPTV